MINDANCNIKPRVALGIVHDSGGFLARLNLCAHFRDFCILRV
jgi:hypothetical protein